MTLTAILALISELVNQPASALTDIIQMMRTKLLHANPVSINVANAPRTMAPQTVA